MILVGYHGELVNYRVYDPETKKVTVSWNVTVHETIEISTATTKKPPTQQDQKDTVYFQEQDEWQGAEIEPADIKLNQPVLEQPRIVQQQDTPPIELRILRDHQQIKRPEMHQAPITKYVSPNTYQKAICSKDSDRRTMAIKEELQALKDKRGEHILQKF